MKKILFLLLFVPILCMAQDDDESTQKIVPIEDGKVVFSTSYDPSLTKQEIHDRLVDLANSMFAGKGVLALEDYEQGIIAFRMKDYLSVEEKLLMTFAMNMRYILIFEYNDNHCSVKIRNINYTEAEEDRGDLSFSAEFIMIDKKYKVLTIKEASQKITDRTIEYMEGIFNRVGKKLKN